MTITLHYFQSIATDENFFDINITIPKIGPFKEEQDGINLSLTLQKRLHTILKQFSDEEFVKLDKKP